MSNRIQLRTHTRYERKKIIEEIPGGEYKKEDFWDLGRSIVLRIWIVIQVVVVVDLVSVDMCCLQRLLISTSGILQKHCTHRLHDLRVLVHADQS